MVYKIIVEIKTAFAFKSTFGWLKEPAPIFLIEKKNKNKTKQKERKKLFNNNVTFSINNLGDERFNDLQSNNI